MERQHEMRSLYVQVRRPFGAQVPSFFSSAPESLEPCLLVTTDYVFEPHSRFGDKLTLIPSYYPPKRECGSKANSYAAGFQLNFQSVEKVTFSTFASVP